MKKAICLMISAVMLSAVPCFAGGDIPTGFSPLSEMKEAQARAALNGKLVVLVVRGRGYDASYSDAAFQTGVKSLGGAVEKIFTRPEEINNADKSGFPQALRDLMKKRLFSSGSACTFVVFDPKMTTVYAEANGGDLLDDRKLNNAFKKKVQDAKKTLK